MTKINLDNPSYLNQLYENNSRLFNISPIRKSPLNQLSETATAVREKDYFLSILVSPIL